MTNVEELSIEELMAMMEQGPAETPNLATADQSDEELLALAQPYIEEQTPIAQGEAFDTEDLIRGNTGARFLQGVADLPQGAFQLGANIGDAAYGGIIDAGKGLDLIDEDFERSSFSKPLNKVIREQKESRQRGQQALGRGEFDAMGLAGEMVGGGVLLKSLPKWLQKLSGVTGGIAAGGGTALITPTASEDEDFWESKASQTAFGAGTGGALTGAAKLSKTTGLTDWAAGKISPYITDAKELAGKAIRDVIGEDKIDEVIAALYKDINPLTKGSAAEVAHKAGSTKFAALQDAVDELLPDQAHARQIEQNRARQAVLDEFADIGPEAIARRERVTAPLREQALGSAEENTRKLAEMEAELATKGQTSFPFEGEANGLNNVDAAVRDRAGLEAQRELAKMRSRQDTSIPGMPRIAPRYSKEQDLIEQYGQFIDDAKTRESLAKAHREMIEYQQRSMGEHGIEAASGNPIVDGITKKLGTPLVEGNPTLGNVMQAVRKDIAGMMDEDGTISPLALYEYRKTGLDATIETYLESSTPVLRQSITKNLTEIKGLVDDVIENASGGGWKRYLSVYEELSEPVNVAEVGTVLKKALQDTLDPEQLNPRVFTNALNDQDKIMRDSGVRKGLDVLNPQQKERVANLSDDLTRAEQVRKQAEQGRGFSKEAMKENYTTQLANPLMREIMVTNAILRSVGAKTQREVHEEIGQLFQRDPEGTFKALAEAIKKADPKDKSMLRQIMAEYTKFFAPAAPGIAGGQLGGQP